MEIDFSAAWFERAWEGGGQVLCRSQWIDPGANLCSIWQRTRNSVFGGAFWPVASGVHEAFQTLVGVALDAETARG